MANNSGEAVKEMSNSVGVDGSIALLKAKVPVGGVPKLMAEKLDGDKNAVQLTARVLVSHVVEEVHLV